VISGDAKATAGRIVFFGEDVSTLAPHQRAARGMARTFQITKLFAELTVFENLLLACAALDARKFTFYKPLFGHADLVRRAEALLDRFGLTALRHEDARNLSYGDQRKLEVALSMAGKPKLLLLDEPMAGLSSAESRSMLALLQQLDPGTAVLLIEHDMDIAFGFAEHVTVLAQGRVLTQGHRDEIAANRDVQQIYLGTADGA
jgi:branched-chain amino acid transport system ATP-binding protein